MKKKKEKMKFEVEEQGRVIVGMLHDIHVIFEMLKLNDRHFEDKLQLAGNIDCPMCSLPAPPHSIATYSHQARKRIMQSLHAKAMKDEQARRSSPRTRKESDSNSVETDSKLDN